MTLPILAMINDEYPPVERDSWIPHQAGQPESGRTPNVGNPLRNAEICPIGQVTRYQPKHYSGRTGPKFRDATSACLWIIRQPEAGWDWEAI